MSAVALSLLSLFVPQHPSSRKKPHIFELNWTLFFLPYNNCPCDFHSLKCACLFNDAVSDPEWFNAFYMMENIWKYFVGIRNIWEKSRKPAINTAHPGPKFEPGTSMTRSRSIARYSKEMAVVTFTNELWKHNKLFQYSVCHSDSTWTIKQ